MKALPNRLIVDVKFKRRTLVSQWPALLPEWVFSKSHDFSLRAGFFQQLRALAMCALCFAVQAALFGLVYVVIWPLRWLVPPEALIWIFISLPAVVLCSFQWSVDTGKPVGLFWIAAQVERPLRPKLRS